MPRSNITKTLGPIHFEDLDPHRFEDLVRELVYDFKDWQSLEATGRGGNDDGFDIRAYERMNKAVGDSDETDPSEEPVHPMDGHVWMFQCKREKEIGPARVDDIVSDGVDATNPPYGYVLAAPANFSKTSYDRFRERLRERGVMEFYLWGRAELEDMLHLPKNDHILFAFFGISLISRRRSRATEIRSVVAAKNKLLKLLGETPAQQPVLIRDIKDVHYPYKEKYKDFKAYPRWREFPVVDMHPLGIVIQMRRCYAFRDSIKSEWDYTDAVSLVHRQTEDETTKAERNLQENVEGFWELFQKSEQVMFIMNGLIRFDSITVIDGEGDSLFKFPHLYVDFQGDRGPFYGTSQYLEIDQYRHETLDSLKRVKKFPKTFESPKIGTVYKDKRLKLNDPTLAFLKGTGGYSMNTFYEIEKVHDFLNPCDVIEVDRSENADGSRIMIKITNKRVQCGKELTESAYAIEGQIGRKLSPADIVSVYEFKRVYDWQVSRRS
jgi:hypothetical protein